MLVSCDAMMEAIKFKETHSMIRRITERIFSSGI